MIPSPAVIVLLKVLVPVAVEMDPLTGTVIRQRRVPPVVRRSSVSSGN